MNGGAVVGAILSAALAGPVFAYPPPSDGDKSRQVEMKGVYTEEYRPPEPEKKPWLPPVHDHPGPKEVGVGLGVSFYWPDLGGVYEFIGLMEEVYRAQGYPIPRHRRRMGSMNVAAVTMRFWYWKSASLQFDIINSTGSELKITGIVPSANVYPRLPVVRWFRPYAGLGLGYWQFRTAVDYEPEVYPEMITASGGQVGLVIRQGVQFWPPAEKTKYGFSGSLYFEYILSPFMEFSGPGGVTGRARFQGRSAGLRVELVM